MTTKRTAFYELITNSKLEQTEESFWFKFLKGMTLSKKYNYLGPGTNLKKNLSEGLLPVNELDKIALVHDLQYQAIGALPENERPKAERLADAQFVKKLSALKRKEEDLKIISDINHSLAAMKSKPNSYIVPTTPLTTEEREQLKNKLGGLENKKSYKRMQPYLSINYNQANEKIKDLYDAIDNRKNNMIAKTLNADEPYFYEGPNEPLTKKRLVMEESETEESIESKHEAGPEDEPPTAELQAHNPSDKELREKQLNLQKIADEDALLSLQNAVNPANYKKPESDDLTKITTGEFPGRPITGERNYNNIQQKAGDNEINFSKHEIDQKEQFYKFFNLVVPGYGEGNQELVGIPNESNIPRHSLKPKNCLLRAQNENIDIRFSGKLRVPAEKPFEYKLTKRALEARKSSMFCDVGQTAVSWIRDTQQQFTGSALHMYRDSFEPTQTSQRNSVYTRLIHPNIVQMQNGRVTRI